MTKSIIEFITAIQDDLAKWETGTKPWFRGESGDTIPLCPKIASVGANIENHLLQSFRRQAGGLADVPDREQTDMWLFLAQHYGVPTRLIDWTEGALLGLYFAINQGRPNPTVYMLNPRRLNELAGSKTTFPNYPLTFAKKGGSFYVALAWQNRSLDAEQNTLVNYIGLNLDIPLAFPATYQDQRMIAQRSCFTIHGTELKSIQDILRENNIEVTECLFEYKIESMEKSSLLRDLSVLGISAATIFPDLDHLAKDLCSEVEVV